MTTFAMNALLDRLAEIPGVLGAFIARDDTLLSSSLPLIFSTDELGPASIPLQQLLQETHSLVGRCRMIHVNFGDARVLLIAMPLQHLLAVVCQAHFSAQAQQQVIDAALREPVPTSSHGSSPAGSGQALESLRLTEGASAASPLETLGLLELQREALSREVKGLEARAHEVASSIRSVGLHRPSLPASPLPGDEEPLHLDVKAGEPHNAFAAGGFGAHDAVSSGRNGSGPVTAHAAPGLSGVSPEPAPESASKLILERSSGPVSGIETAHARSSGSSTPGTRTSSGPSDRSPQRPEPEPWHGQDRGNSGRGPGGPPGGSSGGSSPSTESGPSDGLRLSGTTSPMGARTSLAGPPGSNAGSGPVSPRSTGNVNRSNPLPLSQEVRGRLQHELAQFVGPIARVLLDEQLSQGLSSPQLVERLAREIDSLEDREVFLARVAGLTS